MMTKLVLRGSLVVFLPLVVGCGGSSSGDDPDAGDQPDSGDQGPGQVVVQVKTGSGSGAGGIDVVFHDADGEVLAHVRSAADGTASHEGDIAIVTVLDPERGLRSVYGLHGDMTFDFYLYGADFTPAGEVVVGLPSVGSEGMFVTATNGCSESLAGNTTSGTTIPLVVDTSCVTAQNTIDVYAVRRPSVDGDPSGYAFLADVVHAGGSTTANLTGWSTNLVQTTLTIEDAPERSRSGILQAYFEKQGRLFELSSPMGVMGPLAQGGAFSRVVPYGQGFGDGFAVTASVLLGTDKVEGMVSETSHVASLPVSVTLDGAALLPEIFDVEANVTNPTRPEIRWQARGDLSDADAGGFIIRWSDQFWTGIMPPDHPSPVVVPALPEALRSHGPSASTPLAPPMVIFIDRSDIDGYIPDEKILGDMPPRGERVRNSLGGFSF